MKRRSVIGWLAALLCIASGCGFLRSDNESEARKPFVVELSLSNVVEGMPSRQKLLNSTTVNLYDLLLQLGRWRRQPAMKGLFLRVPSLEARWGQIAELRASLQALRDAGKTVHCHFDSADNLAYWLMAQQCDRLSMTPAGDLDLVGVAYETVYLRDFLDRIGVQADLLQVGRFKGAADPFTERGMPEAVQQSLGLLLDDLYEDLLRGVASRQRIAMEQARKLIDAGPFDAVAAQQLGLVDAVAFEDEARHHMLRQLKTATLQKPQALPNQSVGWRDVMQALWEEDEEPEPKGRGIALLSLQGTIGNDEEAQAGSAQAGPFIRLLSKLERQKSVRAVVLRIDSPGGSALASDRMWHAVKKLSARKPVVVSIGDMAASGGYYVAAASTEVLAQPTSLVGSIGVVGGKVVFGGLADKLGVHFGSLTRGKHAGWTSVARPFNASERQLLQLRMQSTYDRFVRRVAVGRKLSVEQVQASAEGRLMSGRQAQRNQLVDRLGGLRDAIARARALAHLPVQAPVHLWDEKPSMLRSLAHELLGVEAGVPAWKVELPWLQTSLQWLEPWLSGEPVMAMLPYALVR